MISVKNLSKSFGNYKAVNNLSLSVGKGQTLVLLGTSGCGKTTTLRMLNRLIEPDAGEILINGEQVNNVSPEILRRNIGYVLQNIAMFPHYTVAQNISIVPVLLGWDKKRIYQRTLQLLQKLHLQERYMHVYPSELSGGQQQRVGIARALAADPPILLMDEPFSALDPVTRTSIRKDFKQLDELKDKTIVLVTHDVHEAVELADIICLMDKGEIVQTGTPKDLLFRPKNEFVSQFFAGQKLLLQYKIVLLSDLWDFLPSQQVRMSEKPTRMVSTVYDAFAALHADGKANIPVFNKQGSESVMIDAAALSIAFTNFKKSFSL